MHFYSNSVGNLNFFPKGKLSFLNLSSSWQNLASFEGQEALFFYFSNQGSFDYLEKNIGVLAGPGPLKQCGKLQQCRPSGLNGPSPLGQRLSAQ
jgi:hypothetical protein